MALLPVFLLASACSAAWAAPADPKSVVLKAEGGLFARADGGDSGFLASKVLPLRDGQAFGWRMQLRHPTRTVLVREELILPAEPRTWGDPEPDLKRKTSADGRSAITELRLTPEQGVISQSWTVTTGDPKGAWVIKVRVEGGPEHVFRFDAQ